MDILFTMWAIALFCLLESVVTKIDEMCFLKDRLASSDHEFPVLFWDILPSDSRLITSLIPIFRS